MNRPRRPLGPETVTHTYPMIPDDPYEINAIAFSVLAARGYPVSLQPADRDVVRRDQQERLAAVQNTSYGNHLQAHFAHHKGWIVPSAHHADFRLVSLTNPEWLANEDDSVGYFNLPAETAQPLEDHPGRLACYVAHGAPNTINEYHQKLRSGELTPTTVRELDTQGFTGPSLAKAIERAQTPGITFQGFGYIMQKQEYERMGRMLAARDIRPIGAEALAGLVNDFYALTEQLVPEFAAQKDLQPSPQPPHSYGGY
ncbi:MAG TPA: hypothetical protein VJR27_05825 [Candidatus Saccharimonadales bacterium]|nr:hypothetical protein [Candidatus Saccharimonadales bacterium]